jgi:hypothetical protein
MIGRAISVRWRWPISMLLLIVPCIALCGVIVSEWQSWQDAAALPPAPTVEHPSPPPPASFVMPPLATYAEVVSRPLFSANRRPSEDAAPAPVKTSSSMTLIAILISHRGPHALVRHGTPPQLDRVVEGDTVDGWTAETIKFDRVVFRRGSDVLELVPVSAAQPNPVPANPAKPPVRPPATSSRTAG